MRFVLFLVLSTLLICSCRPTSPRVIEKRCCNSGETQWVLIQSANDTGAASYAFLPQVINPGGEGANSKFTSSDNGVANYDIEIRLGKDPIWLYNGPAPIDWDGNVAASKLPAQSGVYNYDLTVTFNNGAVEEIKEQNFCLLREYAVCPENINDCVLRSMFDINDTIAPLQYINEEALLSTGIYKRCD